MTSYLLRSGLVAGAFVAATLVSRASAACSCGGEWTKEDADVVLLGEAVEVHEPLHLQVLPLSNEVAGYAWMAWTDLAEQLDPDVITEFRVDRSWRASAPRFVSFNTGDGLCCNCSWGRRAFDEGGRYVVYAVKDGDSYRINGCAGIAVAERDVTKTEQARLGASLAPTAGQQSFTKIWRHALAPGVLLAPVALVVAWRHRRRRRARA